MKQIIFILLTLMSINCQSQNTNNSIGIGLGNISIYQASILNNSIEITSPFYNSKADFSDRTITRITSPSIYIGKKVYKKLKLRINGSYQYRTFYIDRTGWILEPGPGWNYDKHIYNNVNYLKTLNTNIGFQYNFKIRNLIIYPSIEYASILSWITYKNYYTLSPNTDMSYEEISKEKIIRHSINLVCGIEYYLGKNLSLSYEVGMYHANFSPISRLSININY